MCVRLNMKQLVTIQDDNMFMCQHKIFKDSTIGSPAIESILNSFVNVLVLLLILSSQLGSLTQFGKKNNSLNKTILNLWLYGICYYCFLSPCHKGAVCSCIGPGLWITEPLLTGFFSLPACCISFLILGYLSAVRQAALESGYLVFWWKYFLSYPCHFVLQL